MWGGKCGGKTKLCPVSLGLALGITSALAVLVWSLWILYYGVPPAMAEMVTVTPTLGGAFVHAFWALLKGFIFGFFLALFYDLISCCCKARCCRDSSCGCSCQSEPTDKKM